MRTAIVSDLHLGGASRRRRPPRPGDRARCCRGASPTPTAWSCSATWSSCATCRSALALAAARPFFEELGEALGEREVSIVPGNHDHRFAEPLLDALSMAGEPLGARAPLRPLPRPDRGDRRLARTGAPAPRLPRHLAARGRLRHPRPLHGPPPGAAAGRVHCGRDRRPRSPARCRRRRRRPTTSAYSPLYMASATDSPRRRRRRNRRRGHPAESAWQLLSGERQGRHRQTPSHRRRPAGRLPARHRPRSTASCTADSSPTSPPRRSSAPASQSGVEMASAPRHRRRPRDHRPHPPRRPRAR